MKLSVRVDTIYFAKNWKYCSKIIIFKHMKNYCSLFFYCLYVLVHCLYPMNSILDAGLLKKKKNRKRGKQSKPNLSVFFFFFWVKRKGIKCWPKKKVLWFGTTLCTFLVSVSIYTQEKKIIIFFITVKIIRCDLDNNNNVNNNLVKMIFQNSW